MQNNPIEKQINLPEGFISRMREMLGDEYGLFASSYEKTRPYGLRINTLKWPFKNTFPFTLSPVPWADTGFFAKRDEHPGRHPLHEAGAYYIQEPSAMSAVSLLDPKPNETILDLCAAPGGKSTQIADKLCGKGLLVCNEIISSRAKILSRNIERLGITNAIVLNETPDKLAEKFPYTFDRIVVDAPCSGEGMFCKEKAAISDWSIQNIELCAKRQRHILENADKMLKPNGILVYSTCTFAPEEDEETLLCFLRNHPEYSAEPYDSYLLPDNHTNTNDIGCGLSKGNPNFISQKYKPISDKERNQTECAVRLWPHKVTGEGHFAVRLKKQDMGSMNYPENLNINNKNFNKQKNKSRQKNSFSMTKNEFKVLTDMLSLICKNIEFITNHPDNIITFGDEIYLLPENTPDLHNLKIMRAGLHIATKKKNRFEPAHALAMALHPNEVSHYLELDMETATKFLHGEAIACDTTYSGWVVAGICGCSLGFGKAKNGTLKNHYPKGLRLSF